MTARNNFLSRSIGDLAVASLAEGLDSGDGLVTFTCPDAETLLAAASDLGDIMRHRDSDTHGITTVKEIANRDPERDIGLTRGALPFHTDCPAIASPPSTLILWCRQEAAAGGTALFAQAGELFAYLDENDPDVLEAACQPEAVVFRTGDHVWIGPVFQASAGGTTIRLRLDPHVHFQTALARLLPRLEAALEAVAVPLTLRKGEGYAVLNSTWLHGRRAYRGHRELLRIMLA
jgi:hypothetical protein